jgi:hypothetical protein
MCFVLLYPSACGSLVCVFVGFLPGSVWSKPIFARFCSFVVFRFCDARGYVLVIHFFDFPVFSMRFWRILCTHVTDRCSRFSCSVRPPEPTKKIQNTNCQKHRGLHGYISFPPMITDPRPKGHTNSYQKGQAQHYKN